MALFMILKSTALPIMLRLMRGMTKMRSHNNCWGARTGGRSRREARTWTKVTDR